MTRLIDADAFKKVLSEHEMKHDKRRSFNDYDWGSASAYEYAGDLLDEMPTVEHKHGEWIEKHHERFKYYCSRCGSGADRKGKFCDTCGADMREGEANE